MPTRLSLFGVRIPEKRSAQRALVGIAVALTAVLALVEWRLEFDFSLGIFYTVPVVIAGFVTNRWQILLFAVCCALIRGAFTPAAGAIETLLRFLMATVAYGGAGLLMVEMSRNRQRVLEHYARLKLEQDLRQRAEDQLRRLAESSPAAILTLDWRATVVAANRAAHEMFGFTGRKLIGQSLEMHMPIFAGALRLSSGPRPVRTSVSGWAKRENGTMFPVQAWFSVHGEGLHRYLAAIMVDVSEEMRDRERETFRHLLDYNRLLAGTVSHEIRNLCSAIAVVYSNLLARRAELSNDADFLALSNLVTGLSRLASFELHHKSSEEAVATDLWSVLEQLRIIIEPDWADIYGEVRWEIPEAVPEVQADPHGLLQIFLNLTQNSWRAVSGSETRELTVSVTCSDDDVLVSFRDTGPGVHNPERLFHPFGPGSDGSGLGLYISRALARSFGGDLLHIPEKPGCRFDVMLAAAAPGLVDSAHAD